MLIEKTNFVVEKYFKDVTITVASLGQTVGQGAVAPGFISSALTACTCSPKRQPTLWMDTMYRLDIVGKALDLSQSNVLYPV